MKNDNDITVIAALIGDPAQAATLRAPLSDKALVEGEPAAETDVTPTSTSGPLAQFADAQQIWPRKPCHRRPFAKAVALFNSTAARCFPTVAGKDVTMTDTGGRLQTGPGVGLPTRRTACRPLCRGCLTCSEWRSYLADAPGPAPLRRSPVAGWMTRPPACRNLHLRSAGTAAFARRFPL